MTRVLTGMQSSGTPHWGNYWGMMRQTIDLQEQGKNDCFYFIADLHSFTSNKDPEKFKSAQQACVLDWLALGVDSDKSTFYRQSDVPAHTELYWYLMTLTPMGLLERAHAYKDKKAQGAEANAGLMSYPVLMAADILLYGAEQVPVGKDQKQHVEMARDIAQKFNNQFGETFVLPEPVILEEVQTVPGVDGRKMSKSYGNDIGIFEDEKSLKKKIMSIQTDSKGMGEKLDPESCPVFAFHKLFGNPNLETLRGQYQNGEIGYGDSKKQLFELVWEYFGEARAKREELAKDPRGIQEIMQEGAQKAAKVANVKLAEVRGKMGLSPQHLG